MKFSLFAALVILPSLLIAQSQKTTSPQLLDIKSIAGKTVPEIEKVLGKPSSNTLVQPSGTPCKQSPCTKLGYKDDMIEIVFINGKADWITINETDKFPCSPKSLELIGLKPTEPTFQKKDVQIRWEDRFNLKSVQFFDWPGNKLGYIYIRVFTK